jgi:hypothetical protein
MGLFGVTCKPLAMLSTVSLLRPSASTWNGSLVWLLNMPDLNISKLAIARPSLRR